MITFSLSVLVSMSTFRQIVNVYDLKEIYMKIGYEFVSNESSKPYVANHDIDQYPIMSIYLNLEFTM